MVKFGEISCVRGIDLHIYIFINIYFYAKSIAIGYSD
jgi:hypothetical protein